MSISARLFALILVLAAAGCAGTGTAARKGGWIEVRSANFSIYTPLAERDARAILDDLELFRAAVLMVTRAESVRPPVPTEICAFRSEDDFRPFLPRENAAGFFHPTLRVNYGALAGGTRAGESRATFYHEYTHFLLQNERAEHQPLWFDEGFAELLSSIAVRGKNVRIGDPPRNRGSWLRSGSSMPYSRVLRAQSLEGLSEDELQMYDAQSWLLVHHLMLRKDSGGDFAAQMQQYVKETGRGVEPEEAFRESFGIEVDDLPARLKKYEKQLPVFGIPRERLEVDPAVEVRDVPSDEIDTRLGWLAMNGGQTELARQHFERAIAANPNNARASAGMGDVNKLGRDWEAAEAAYHRSLEIAPGDWQNHLDFAEYWIERSVLTFDLREEHLATAREELARSIQLAPGIPESHAVLGSTYLISYQSGDQPPGPGIEALKLAVKLLPGNSEIEYSLARLYLRAEDRERALPLLRRVVHRPHATAGPQAALILEAVEQSLADDAKRSEAPAK